MKRHLFLTLVLVSAFAYISEAQLVKDLHTIYNQTSSGLNSSSSDSVIFSQYGIIKPGKPVYNVEFGAGYTSFGKGMGFSNTSISPTVAFAPTNKVTVVAGASFSRTNFNNMPEIKNASTNGSTQQSNGNPTQAFAYGQYQINNRLCVYAMGSFAKNQYVVSPYNAGIGKADYQQFGVGFNYKLGSKTTIGASFNFSNGTNYMGLSPNSYNTFSPMFP